MVNLPYEGVAPCRLGKPGLVERHHYLSIGLWFYSLLENPATDNVLGSATNVLVYICPLHRSLRENDAQACDRLLKLIAPKCGGS